MTKKARLRYTIGTQRFHIASRAKDSAILMGIGRTNQRMATPVTLNSMWKNAKRTPSIALAISSETAGSAPASAAIAAKSAVTVVPTLAPIV